MEVSAPPGGNPALKALLRYLVAASFVALGAFCVVVFLHALLSAPYLVPAIYALGAEMAAFASASMLLGVWYAWGRFPQHRRAVAFVVGLTLATLLAHAFIINVPPVSTPHSVTGSIRAGFSDPQVTVNGQVMGYALLLTVTDSGTNAIAGLEVTAPGVPLGGSGFSSPPSFSAPLAPQQSVSGTWTVPAGANLTTVTVSYQELTCYSVKDHQFGCIMDEIYYVPEGMAIFNGERCATGPSAPTYCHLEHPFLAPALIAAGMAVFGEYAAAGWRVMPALLGTFSIPLLFGIAWKLSGDKKIAYLSAAFLALDVMFFSQSSAGLLDVPEVFFGLAAFFAYFAGLRWWKADRYVVAGVLLGLSGLAKETAVFTAMALFTYIAFFGEGGRWDRAYSILKTTLVVGVVFAAGLQAYDVVLATPAVPTFVQNVSYILSYGSSLVAKQLACLPTTGYWCLYPNDPGGPPILPTDWLVYYSPVAYYLVTLTVGTTSYVSVGYYGVTNLLVSWTTWIWAPLAAWGLYSYRRSLKKGPAAAAPGGPVPPPGMPQELKFAAFALILFLWSYVPYLFLMVAGRVTYPFYMVPAVPAIAMGASYWMTRRYFPRWLLYVYLVMVFGFFLVYFPDKSFLPVWVRVLLRH